MSAFFFDFKESQMGLSTREPQNLASFIKIGSVDVEFGMKHGTDQLQIEKLISIETFCSSGLNLKISFS